MIKMEKENIISISKMIDFINFYKNKLEQKNQQQLKLSEAKTVEEVEVEKQLQPLKEKLEMLEIVDNVDEAITIIDEQSEPEVSIEIETNLGTNTYSKINEHKVTNDGTVLPSIGYTEESENTAVGMALDHDLMIHQEICGTLDRIEPLLNNSWININTTEDGLVFKFNLNEQSLVFRNKEKSIQSISKRDLDLEHIGISKEDIPPVMMEEYAEFEKYSKEKSERKKSSVVLKLIKKLGIIS